MLNWRQGCQKIQTCHYSFDSNVWFYPMIKNLYFAHGVFFFSICTAVILGWWQHLDISCTHLFGASSLVNNLLMEVWIYQFISKSTLARQLFNFSLQAPLLPTSLIICWMLQMHRWFFPRFYCFSVGYWTFTPNRITYLYAYEANKKVAKAAKWEKRLHSDKISIITTWILYETAVSQAKSPLNGDLMYICYYLANDIAQLLRKERKKIGKFEQI